MDAWMLRELGSDVQVIHCPKCSTTITFSYRYGNLIKRTLTNIENVKKQIQELANETINLASDLVRDRSRLTYDVQMMNAFPRNLLNMVVELSSRPNTMALHRMQVRSIPLIFTLKNHLLIMHQVDRANDLLQKMAKDQAMSKQQLELKDRLNSSKDALEKIKEYLEKPQLDLRTLNQVHEHTRTFFLFSLILEAQSEAIRRNRSFSSIGESRLQLARRRFDSFLQGKNEALLLDLLERIVSLLRIEVSLPPLPPEEPKDFENFPGFNRGVWKCCRQRHVYFMRSIVRDGKDVTVGREGCSQCTVMEERG
ncbi:NFX1-type zinc finger-containing protein 1 [Desmophyllum pertusum]|uniref:NFX1-type zinc finger-containing protein 1 n=1 Tax=Desmophyllum pertusum TaxID=174260 RepID=A0A9W9ZNW1_9CNID|nr:NFX1-type zinc finger-containing protein 1 [Desmophyllum pertusum]